MGRVLMVFVLIWSSGLQTQDIDTFKETEDIRLVEGSSRCSGLVQVKCRGTWMEVDDFRRDLKFADVFCRRLDCGSVVQALSKYTEASRSYNPSPCIQSNLRKKRSQTFPSSLEIICSDSVRLVNGTSLCSGRLEVKSSQSWSSVCEDAFDLQDAEVTCRQLGCGAPSVLKGWLYGETKTPVLTRKFNCEGNESALLKCGSSDSSRDTCSSGKAVGLTCSEPDTVRLVGGSSRCAGELEVNQQGRWKKVDDETSEWNLKAADAVCKQLDCGFAVSTRKKRNRGYEYLWLIKPACLLSESVVRECVFTKYDTSLDNLLITCSEKLAQPVISFSAYNDGVSEAEQQELQVLMGSSFNISCSILPQYPGGSFQLIHSTSSMSQNYTLPAVSHSAHFLFSAADHTHQGDYRCVYQVYVFNRNISSESQPLQLTVSASLTGLTISISLVMTAAVFAVALLLYCKAAKVWTRQREVVYHAVAEELLGEEAQGTE